MRFVVIFFIGVMYLSGKISAQERDSLVEITVGDQPRIVSEHHGIQLRPGLGIRPSLYQNFSGYDFPDHTLPTINFHYGYKFSEKFSTSAGFTIQQYNDPLNRNQRMQNIGIFP